MEHRLEEVGGHQDKDQQVSGGASCPPLAGPDGSHAPSMPHDLPALTAAVRELYPEANADEVKRLLECIREQQKLDVTSTRRRRSSGRRQMILTAVVLSVATCIYVAYLRSVSVPVLPKVAEIHGKGAGIGRSKHEEMKRERDEDNIMVRDHASATDSARVEKDDRAGHLTEVRTADH